MADDEIWLQFKGETLRRKDVCLRRELYYPEGGRVVKMNLPDRLNRVTMLKEKVDLQRPLSTEVIRELKADFLIKSTYHSNAIEGNTLTVFETKAVLEDGITIAGKSMREHLEAINHKEAILVAEEIVQEEIPFSERVVKDLHLA